jgi:hypothetical protein
MNNNSNNGGNFNNPSPACFPYQKRAVYTDDGGQHYGSFQQTWPNPFTATGRNPNCNYVNGVFYDDNGQQPQSVTVQNPKDDINSWNVVSDIFKLF